MVVDGTSVSGSVVDRGSLPLGGARTALCTETSECVEAVTDAAGGFVLAPVAAGVHRLDLRGPAAELPPSFGGITLSVEVLADTPHVFEAPFVLPLTGQGAPLKAGLDTVDVTDELTLSVDLDALTLPSGIGEPHLAGVLVAEEHWPPNALPSSTVAVWAFNPYGATSSSEMKLVIHNVFELEPLRGVELHSVDHETGLLVKVTEGRVGSDGLLIELDKGILRLTWLILALIT